MREKPIDITAEDAIKTIQELMVACTPDSKYYKVGKMAIQALSQEPCDFVFEIDYKTDVGRIIFSDKTEKHVNMGAIMDSSEFKLAKKAYECGKAEAEALQQELCIDAVLQAVSEGCQELRGVYSRCEELIKELPFVKSQEPKTVHCSEDLSKRVEILERQMKEDKEEQIKKLKAEMEYAKFCCTLNEENIKRWIKYESRI